MRSKFLFAGALLLVAAPALSQTVTQLGDYRDAGGQRVRIQGVTVLDSNGAPATLGGSSGWSGPARGGLTDGSGSITTGGTSQQVFAGNALRNYISCQNPVSATETLFVNFGAAASTTGGSYELGPGGSITFDHNFIPSGTVNVVAATALHRFICRQG